VGGVSHGREVQKGRGRGVGEAVSWREEKRTSDGEGGHERKHRSLRLSIKEAGPA